MKIKTIHRKLNEFYTIHKYNNYYFEDTMYGSILVLGNFNFSYKVIVKDWIEENDRAVLIIDCAKYNIHVEYSFYEQEQTVSSICNQILMIIKNMQKTLLNVVYTLDNNL